MSWKYKFRPNDIKLVLDYSIDKYGEETTLKKLKEELKNYPEQPIFLIQKNILGKTKIKWF